MTEKEQHKAHIYALKHYIGEEINFGIERQGNKKNMDKIIPPEFWIFKLIVSVKEHWQLTS